MLSKLFVALNFRSDSSLSRKIDGFKKRYDPKYRQRSFPHMALLAPFEVNSSEVTHLRGELREELESFFYGHNSPIKLGFSGVGIFQSKRNNVVYLTPRYCPDLKFCSDLVTDICTSFIPANQKYKPNENQFLPMGYFSLLDNMVEVIEQLKMEFTLNSELTIDGISLYEQKNGSWLLKENLISFENTQDSFLQLQERSI
ncbi:MAG: 2'-5' RNA ligase family protein [Bacteriovoracaceae bacterium]|nr:2'-5' RNA ligase family protein [Bacteriovoracaceae bacterium]